VAEPIGRGANVQSEQQTDHARLPFALSPLRFARTYAEFLMLSIIQILLLILSVAQFIIIAHIILSWLINFQVLSLNNAMVASIWDGLNRLLEPAYQRIRQFLPDLGGIDLAPLIALIAIYAIRVILINNAAAFI
jgi:YggT family protein